MQLIAARPEVAALTALPQGSHHPPLALRRCMNARFRVAFSCFLLYYSTFFFLVNRKTPAIKNNFFIK